MDQILAVHFAWGFTQSLCGCLCETPNGCFVPGVMAQTTVHQLEGPVTAKEGDAFQINCTYQTANFYGLAWYQQWEGKAPGLVSYQVAAGQEEYGRFTAFLSTAGKYSLLHLKETWVSDAASYLCAVRDTLTPGPQQGRGAPSFLGTGHDGSSTAGEFTMAVHKASRSTNLTRDGASLSDAGIYYCAVSLLGNKDTLLTISSFSSTVTPRSFSAELAAIRPRTKGWLIPLPCWRKSHVAGDALRMEDRLASWFP
nr:uncharacterized protein LOC101936070 [Chrysemys picta bellii]